MYENIEYALGAIDFKMKMLSDVVEKADNNVVVFSKTGNMSRLKQNQNIDNLIQGIEVIAKNQCSLSEQDAIVLNEAIERLRALKRKKGKTNQQIQDEFVRIIDLLNNFFV